MTDYQRYHQLIHAMKCMVRAGKHNYQIFQDAWEESNEILNRHGGLPPMPDTDETIDDENQILAETGVEMGVR